MDPTFKDLYTRLIPWICERTALDRDVVVKVIQAQEKFWEIYGEQIEKALENDEDDE